MTTAHGPVVGRRRLRIALRRSREAANLTQDQVAAEMDWSLSKLIRIEAGQVSISTNDLKAILTLYEVTEAKEISELLELARVSRQRPWWSGYKDRYEDRLAPHVFSYIGLEAETSSMRTFDPLLVPGLLQTPAYARAIVREVSPYQRSADELEAIVQIRLTRQREVLGRADPPEFLVVLDEAALRRPVGGAETMREQLRQLAASEEQAHLTVKVLPFSTGPYPAMYGPFVILEFPTQADSPVVFLENAFSGDVLERAEDVGPYRRAFEKISEMALSTKESARLLNKVADEFD
jgi:transcriptional regulator with XRE-family HTH domain